MCSVPLHKTTSRPKVTGIAGYCLCDPPRPSAWVGDITLYGDVELVQPLVCWAWRQKPSETHINHSFSPQYQLNFGTGSVSSIHEPGSLLSTHLIWGKKSTKKSQDELTQIYFKSHLFKGIITLRHSQMIFPLSCGSLEMTIIWLCHSPACYVTSPQKMCSLEDNWGLLKCF